MAAVDVSTTRQITKENLQLTRTDRIPALRFTDEVDTHRRLSLVVPLDSFQATWVEYEETPTFLNTAQTRFIVRPPFDGRRPPRFTFYYPHEEGAVLDKETFVSVVNENEPFDTTATSTWDVYSIHAQGAPLASGKMVRQTEHFITLLDENQSTEREFSWPNPNIRLERSAPFRTGAGTDDVLLGQCPAGLPTPIGVRYGIAECLNARLSYMLDLKRTDGGIPTYECIAQRQYIITNTSDITFSRVRNIAVSSETLSTSADGHPTRSLVMESSPEPPSVVRPLFSLFETMVTLSPRTAHIFTEVTTKTPQSYIAATTSVVPTTVNQFASVSLDAWLPGEFTSHIAVQPGAVQIHVEHGTSPHDAITSVAYWQRDEDSAHAPWIRLPLSGGTSRVSVQCVTKEIKSRQYEVTLAVINYFRKPMLLAFALQPGLLDVCSAITVVSGAQPVPDFPWASGLRGETHAVFITNDRNEAIVFRGTVLTQK